MKTSLSSKFTSCLFFLGFICLTFSSIPNENIVIGIFTQEYWYDDHKPISDDAVLTYIGPVYVNVAAMAGAKVVPINSYSSKQHILSQLDKVNGVIFTGGEQYISVKNLWARNAKLVLEYAKSLNDKGITFPILGICQGLQLMLYLTSNLRQDFLDEIHGQNGVWNTINFKSDNFELLKGLSSNAMKALTDPTYTKQKGTVYFWHSNGTLLQTFRNDQDISRFWNLIGTSRRDEQEFVTYLQAYNYPFYITQFHPQRLTYQSNFSQQLFTSRIQIIHTISFNFIKKCRENPHVYPRDQLLVDIIDNNTLYDSNRFGDYPVYLFNEYQYRVQKYLGSSQKQATPTSINMLMVILLVAGLVIFGYRYKKSHGTYRNQGQITQNINPLNNPNYNVNQFQGNQFQNQMRNEYDNSNRRVY